MRRAAFASIVGLALIVASVSGCGGSGGGKPAVAIEGTIVFARPYKGQHSDIYLLDAQGTRQLVANGDLMASYPVWSPDGTQIAYITDTLQLAVVKRDGSGGATLTPKTSDSSLWPWRPAWLPDGNISIAVAGKLAVLRPDGSPVRVLTPSHPKDPTRGFAGSYAWSPDGTQVIFDCGNSVTFSEVCLFDVASGKSRTLLERAPWRFQAFAWSPDGKKIVAGDWGGGTTGIAKPAEDLYLFDANGQGLHALAQPGRDSNPAWSPDGSMIAYESGQGDLWVMNSDGSSAQRLLTTKEDRAMREPDWTAY